MVTAVPAPLEDPTPGRLDPGSRTWRVGLLALLAIGAVVGGVFLFGGFGDSSAAADASRTQTMTIPPLPSSTSREDAAPDFSVELFDGGRFVLSTHLRDDGRPVILNLWASWCPPCRAEMPDFSNASIAHPDVLILGVAVDDDPLAAAAFVKEFGIAYPTGFDETGAVGRTYRTPGLPATYVISADGDLITNMFGMLTSQDIEALIEIPLGG
jgi:thiol-disulfide isomerase/thioredoxin